MNAHADSSFGTRALDLALRLVSPIQSGQAPDDLPQLLVGELPPDLPVEVPVPEASPLVGSYIHRHGDITIFLDTPLSPEAVLEYYAAQLSTAGWTELELRTLPAGFRAGNRERLLPERPTYCHGPNGPSLTLILTASSERPTEVRLYLQPEGRNACADPVIPSGGAPLFPDLDPPVDAQLYPKRRGGSDQFAQTEADLFTDLDLPTVVAHYAEQMEHNSWTRRAYEEIGPYVWSTWAHSDPERRRNGITFLSILQHPGMLALAGASTLTERPQIVQLYTLDMCTSWEDEELASS